MSFSDLRSARKSKESKSFVKSVITDAATEDVVITKDTFSAAQDGGSGNSEIVSLENMSVGLPSTLEIRKSAAFGRSMYAKEQFAIGSVLISVKPRIAVLSTAFLDSHCSTCCNPATPAGLKRCTRCRTVWYCDAVFIFFQACQTRDWTLHKHECNALQQWAAVVPSSDLSVPSDAVRCLGRMLWYVQKKGADSAWTKELNMMQSHRASLPSSASESYTHLAHFVVRYLGVGSPSDLANFGLSSAGDLVDLISRFTTNTFTLSSFSLTPIGICVAPVVALANHSCEANAAIVFPFCNTAMQEPQMQLIAIRPILQDEQTHSELVKKPSTKRLRSNSKIPRKRNN
ncbi:hypothetical protein EW026_g5345 [Hermanssonia centrifuga]|uniref:MYND-type domain-containing protein n=1 Tax=Hermanssonia centrifuga TaxID=98765 RepID=A0A4S4KEM4_9APHY|nr:hypothetical protein EW026_g5345 [Hermanssonia centrifuga]